MNVDELCEEITRKRADIYSRDLGPWPKNNMTASDIGECQRESVLAITQWRERPPFDPEIKARLERGNKIEDLVLAELQQLGYRIRVERKPFEIKDRNDRLVCRGKVDGFLEVSHGVEFPFECKSLTPNVFSRINEEADFDQYHFFKKYPKQLQCYLYANNFEQGFWIIDDCLGHWKLIPCELDLVRMEKILQHLESVADHLAAKTIPDYHQDPSICVKCWARGRVCQPPFFSGEGMKQIEDVEIASKITELHALEDAATRYDWLDKDLKTTLKEAMKPGDTLVIWPWLINADEKERNFKANPATEAKKIKYISITYEKMG